MTDNIQAITKWVDQFTPDLTTRAAGIDHQGTIPPDIVESLRDSGIFSLWLPTELGGCAAHPIEVLDIIATLARADASTGWLAAIGIASNTVAAYLPREVAHEMFSTRTKFAAGNLRRLGTLTPQADDSLHVSGTWPFGSCVEHADWILCGVRSADSDTLSADVAVVGKDAVSGIEPWTAMGLRGTGSGYFHLRGAPVQRDHCYNARSQRPWAQGPLWQIPTPNLLFLAIAGVAMGIGQRAVDELIRKNASTEGPDELRLEQCAKAIALLNSADAYLRNTLQQLLPVDSPQHHAMSANLGVRLAIVNAGQSVASAVELCYRATGSEVFTPESPTERALRDITTAIQHIAFNPKTYTEIGHAIAKHRATPT